MNLLIMQLSPASCYLMPFRSKYPPPHPVLCSSLNVRDQVSHPYKTIDKVIFKALTFCCNSMFSTENCEADKRTLSSNMSRSEGKYLVCMSVCRHVIWSDPVQLPAWINTLMLLVSLVGLHADSAYSDATQHKETVLSQRSRGCCHSLIEWGVTTSSETRPLVEIEAPFQNTLKSGK
jgi:hypothetical protein